MKTLLTLILLALVLAPMTLSARDYRGREAQALKCAVYFSYTAQILEEKDELSTERALAANQIALGIMENHVRGTFEEKIGGYNKALSTLPKSEEDIVDEANKNIDWCSKHFVP